MNTGNETFYDFIVRGILRNRKAAEDSHFSVCVRRFVNNRNQIRVPMRMRLTLRSMKFKLFSTVVP